MDYRAERSGVKAGIDPLRPLALADGLSLNAIAQPPWTLDGAHVPPSSARQSRKATKDASKHARPREPSAAMSSPAAPSSSASSVVDNNANSPSTAAPAKSRLTLSWDAEDSAKLISLVAEQRVARQGNTSSTRVGTDWELIGEGFQPPRPAGKCSNKFTSLGGLSSTAYLEARSRALIKAGLPPDPVSTTRHDTRELDFRAMDHFGRLTSRLQQPARPLRPTRHHRDRRPSSRSRNVPSPRPTMPSSCDCMVAGPTCSRRSRGKWFHHGTNWTCGDGSRSCELEV